jgi:hypothetical protein
MVELNNNKLVFSFSDIHKNAVCQIDFQRTLRIPDDNREYPLPPGLGSFPLEHVEDHSGQLPSSWSTHGGVLLPMYQAEAMWLKFSSKSGYPFAVKVAAGKINAVTGEPWRNDLVKQPQDYVVVPRQEWLDGFCVQKGLVRQFVAMPLGQGYTAEEQISGTAEHGGLQIVVYPMKREHYLHLQMRARSLATDNMPDIRSCSASKSADTLGLAPGGLMRQKIYEDYYGHNVWDLNLSNRCFIHIFNSKQWMVATGKQAPGKPPTASDYTDCGLPWFDYYDDSQNALGGAKKLTGLDSVAAKSVKLGNKPYAANHSIKQPTVISISSGSNQISDGEW